MPDDRSARRGTARINDWSDSDDGSSSTSSSSDGSLFGSLQSKKKRTTMQSRRLHEPSPPPTTSATNQRNNSTKLNRLRPTGARQTDARAVEHDKRKGEAAPGATTKPTRRPDSTRNHKKHQSQHSKTKAGSDGSDDGLTSYTRRVLEQQRKGTTLNGQHAAGVSYRETTRTFTRKVVPKKGLVYTSEGKLRRWKSESQELKPAVPRSIRDRLDQRARALALRRKQQTISAREPKDHPRRPSPRGRPPVETGSPLRREPRLISPQRRGSASGDPEQYKAYAERVARGFRTLQSQGPLSAWGEATCRSGDRPNRKQKVVHSDKSSRRDGGGEDKNFRNRSKTFAARSSRKQEEDSLDLSNAQKGSKGSGKKATSSRTRQQQHPRSQSARAHQATTRTNAMHSRRSRTASRKDIELGWSSDDSSDGGGESASSEDEWFRKATKSKRNVHKK
jgi:hypothetical protein